MKFIWISSYLLIDNAYFNKGSRWFNHGMKADTERFSKDFHDYGFNHGMEWFNHFIIIHK